MACWTLLLSCAAFYTLPRPFLYSEYQLPSALHLIFTKQHGGSQKRTLNPPCSLTIVLLFKILKQRIVEKLQRILKRTVNETHFIYEMNNDCKDRLTTATGLKKREKEWRNKTLDLFFQVTNVIPSCLWAVSAQRTNTGTCAVEALESDNLGFQS